MQLLGCSAADGQAGCVQALACEHSHVCARTVRVSVRTPCAHVCAHMRVCAKHAPGRSPVPRGPPSHQPCHCVNSILRRCSSLGHPASQPSALLPLPPALQCNPREQFSCPDPKSRCIGGTCQHEACFDGIAPAVVRPGETPDCFKNCYCLNWEVCGPAGANGDGCAPPQCGSGTQLKCNSGADGYCTCPPSAQYCVNGECTSQAPGGCSRRRCRRCRRGCCQSRRCLRCRCLRCLRRSAAAAADAAAAGAVNMAALP